MKTLSVVSGILGPVLFAIMTALLTWLQYDFLLSLGWDPLHDPTHDWPSGLSLGPYGGWMIATFILCGLMLALFGLGLRSTLQPGFASNAAVILMVIAGLAMVGESFLTDPLYQGPPHTWHGVLHDTFFVILGLSLMPGMVFLGRALRRQPRSKGLGTYTWVTAAFALPAFFLKGAAFYVFLAAVLVWAEVLAWGLAPSSFPKWKGS
jgi:hypothetical protein